MISFMTVSVPVRAYCNTEVAAEWPVLLVLAMQYNVFCQQPVAVLLHSYRAIKMHSA